MIGSLGVSEIRFVSGGSGGDQDDVPNVGEGIGEIIDNPYTTVGRIFYAVVEGVYDNYSENGHEMISETGVPDNQEGCHNQCNE
ncbi:MAG: hypothetical protein MRY72_12885 [Aquisalinus sp.]|nr:hypothetical protein [Aquisalinus sp.]